MQQNINPYVQSEFEPRFKQTEYYKKLEKDFDFVTFTYHYDDFLPVIYKKITSRQFAGSTKFSAVSFYYLEYLLEKNPSKIVDLGCGWNIFKKYIPIVWGIDHLKWSHIPLLDEEAFVDDKFFYWRRGTFESVFSINSLHFNIGLTKIRQRVIDFSNLLVEGGRGYIALDLKQLRERDEEYFKDFSIEQIEQWTRNELDNLPMKILVFDLNFGRTNDWMDGNIRIVLEK